MLLCHIGIKMAENAKISPNDLSILLNEVISMSPRNVVNFGIQLNITHNVIEGFDNRDMKQCLREILNERLKREPPLTWPDIVTALRAGCVGESRLAREIEARHMPSSQPPSSGPPQPERAEASLTPHPQTIAPSFPQQTLINCPYPTRPIPHHPQLQHHTQLSHPQDNVPQYQQYNSTLCQYPLRLLPVNTATRSGSQVQDTADPPAAKRPRLRPSVNEATQSRSYVQATTVPVPARGPTLAKSEASPSQFIERSVPPQPSVQLVSVVSDHVVTPAVEVINRHTSHLTETFGNDLQTFSGRFVECGFISSSAANDISSKHGIGNQQRGSELLNLVIANCRVTCDSRKWFDTFLKVLSSERAYEELSSSIREEFTALHSSSVHNTAESVQEQGMCIEPFSAPPADQYALPISIVNEATHSGYQVQVRVSPPTSDPFTMLSEYVKILYRESAVRRDTSVVKWPPTPSTVFINLALIDRKIVSGKSKEYEKVTKDMVRDGNVDVINATKGPIEFSEIGKNIYFPLNSDSLSTSPDDQREKGRRLILVEGAPGVGKSTFAWEYCRRWERGEIAQQYQLVLLLRLRDDKTSRAENLRDLIQHSSEKVRSAVCEELEATGGANTMIILEGFDELPDVCRTMSSVFMQLIHGGQLLPLATVMVTSRPWATHIVRVNCSHCIFQHIEILGFTRQQISEYVESILLDSEARRDLEIYIKRHPQIGAGMYIPLNSAIVVTVYQESQVSGCLMPTTLTELYTALVMTLLVRYLRGHPEYGINSIQRFSDLPPAVYTKFLKLCGVAYNGIVSTNDQVQLVFSERDLPADFDKLGLMDSVTELYVTQGTVSSHNFLHLTFQEFFAAVHISNMSLEQQLEHFQRGRKQSDDDEERSGEEGSGHRGQSGDGRLKVVLRFLAGLNKLNCFLKDAINHFIKTPTRHEREKYHLSCDAEVDIDLLNWMFEAQSDDAIALLLEQKRIEISIDSYDNMLPMNYYSLGYCIAHSKCQWLLSVEEDTNEEVEEERVRMLGAGASTSDGGQGGKIVVLGGTDNRVLTLSFKCLNMALTEWKSILQLHQLSLGLQVPCDAITWPDLSQLRVLELLIYESRVKLDLLLPHLSLESLTITGGVYDGRLEYEDCVAIEHHLKNTLTLKHISISGYDISASGLLVLVRAIHDHPTLQEKKLEVNITIEGDDEARDLAQLHNKYPDIMVNSTEGLMVTGSSDAGEVALAQALRHNSTLRKLKLSNNSISDVGAVTLAQALHPNSTLIWLHMSHNSISDAGAVALAQPLHHNSTLEGLLLSHNSISDAGTVALAHALHHNSTLEVLDLSDNSISDAGAVALAQALHHNSTQERLYLSNNSISDAGAKALAQALHHNSTLKGLVLSNNSISDAAAVALALALHHNSTLEWLDLSNNSISDVTAVALAHALHHNSTLDVLLLSNNSISDVGAVELAQALHHNSTLRVLDLAGNDRIGKEGTCQLVEALTVNSSIGRYGSADLTLPRRSEEYATQCPLYHTVKNKVNFK